MASLQDSLGKMASDVAKPASSAKPYVLKERFGAAVAEVGITFQGKNAGNVYHAINIDGHFWQKLTIPFMATLAGLGVSFPEDILKAAAHAHTAMTDKDVVKALKAEYTKAKGGKADGKPASAPLAAQLAAMAQSAQNV